MGDYPLRRRRFSITVTLSSDLVRAIDEVRGPIPRSRFIEFLVEEGLKAYGSKSGGGLGKG